MPRQPVITIGNFAKEVFCIYTDSSSPYYGWLNSAFLWPPVSGGGTNVHNDLTGLQGGTTNQYYHLTAAQVSALHTRLHSITSTSDHSSTATPGKMLKADASGLPIEATDTDVDVAATVEVVKASGALTSQLSVGPSSNTETQICVATLPAYILSAGTSIQINAHGYLSSKASSPGSATWRARIGPTTLIGSVVVSLGIASMTTNMVSQPWHLRMDITMRTAGSGGTVAGMGYVHGSLGALATLLLVSNPVVAAAGVDTTVQNLVELTFQFGTSDISNVIICELAEVNVVVR
jgi:hypothetical protein